MSDLLTSLIERHSMRWTVVTAMPQILGCKQKAMKFDWNLPSTRKMLAESGDHGRMFGKRQTLPFEKGLCHVEHGVVHAGGREVWIRPLQQPLCCIKTTSSFFK